MLSKNDDLITLREPPEKRVSKTDGLFEKHFSEAAVMLAYAANLFESHSDLVSLEVHPDGEHGKRFDIRGWLERRGFKLIEPQGKTSYGGLYKNGKRSVLVSLKPGEGDVVAELGSGLLVAECKGGVINTRHSGQKSRLRSGLCEIVGLLMSRKNEGEKQVAVVPQTNDTERLADRMRKRCEKAGIEIVLLRENGAIK